MTVSKRKRIPDILGLHVLLCVYTLSKFPQCNRVPSQTTPESISIIFGNWIYKPVFTFSAFQCSHCWWKTALFFCLIYLNYFPQSIKSIKQFPIIVMIYQISIWNDNVHVLTKFKTLFKSKITNPSNLFHHLYNI